MSDKTATEMLSEISNKLDHIEKVLLSNDLTYKILIQRISSVEEILKAKPVTMPNVVTKPTISMTTETIVANSQIPMATIPEGVRRTSRDAVIKPVQTQIPQAPSQNNTVVVPVQAPIEAPTEEFKEFEEQGTPGVVPVSQKVVDIRGKAIFLANVNIVGKLSGEIIHKLKTKANGKWVCTLLPGEYVVHFKKGEIEKSQDITVLNKENFELPTYILR
jgi:hypothetical protein